MVVVTSNDAEVAPVATAIDAGTERVALPSERETTVPPEGAAFERVTVQTSEALEGSVVDEQDNELRTSAAVIVRELDLDSELKVAVSVAV